MGLSIKKPEVERLVEEISALTGENKTESIRRALEERKARLDFEQTKNNRKTRLLRCLENEIWPTVPDHEIGRRLSREEEEDLLGYGEAGV